MGNLSQWSLILLNDLATCCGECRKAGCSCYNQDAAKCDGESILSMLEAVIKLNIQEASNTKKN